MAPRIIGQSQLGPGAVTVQMDDGSTLDVREDEARALLGGIPASGGNLPDLGPTPAESLGSQQLGGMSAGPAMADASGATDASSQQLVHDVMNRMPQAAAPLVDFGQQQTQPGTHATNPQFAPPPAPPSSPVEQINRRPGSDEPVTIAPPPVTRSRASGVVGAQSRPSPHQQSPQQQGHIVRYSRPQHRRGGGGRARLSDGEQAVLLSTEQAAQSAERQAHNAAVAGADVTRAYESLEKSRASIAGDIRMREQELQRDLEAAEIDHENRRASLEKARNAEVRDPWSSRSTGSKIAAAIAIGLGSYAQALGGGPNTALQIINDAMERDVNEQLRQIEQGITSAREGVSESQAERNRLLAEIDDLPQRRMLAQADALATAEREIQAIGSRLQNTQQVEQLNVTAGELRARRVGLEEQMRAARQQRIAAANARRNQGFFTVVNPNDPSEYQIFPNTTEGRNAMAKWKRDMRTDGGGTVEERRFAREEDRRRHVPNGGIVPDTMRETWATLTDAERGRARERLGAALSVDEAMGRLAQAVEDGGATPSPDERSAIRRAARLVSTRATVAMEQGAMSAGDREVAEGLTESISAMDRVTMGSALTRVRGARSMLRDNFNARMRPDGIQMDTRQSDAPAGFNREGRGQ